MSKNVSMSDIAKELNISKSLVSRGLSDRYGVSDEMRSKIKMAAMRMGYVFPAKSKHSAQKVESITVVIERHDLMDSGFWVKIVNAIEKALNERNICVFLSAVDSSEECSLPLSVRHMKTSGAMILGKVPAQHIASVAARGLPVVLVDTPYANMKFDCVMANNYTAAYDATDFMIKHGHKKLAFVGAPGYASSFRERYRGFMDCVADSVSDEIQIFRTPDDYDDQWIPFNRDSFKEMMSRDDRPSALICANDPVAFMVYEIINSLGLKAGDDISVIGFDNVPQSEWVNPPLTTVDIPKTAMAERAVELMLRRIDNPDRCLECTLLGTHIIKRSSVSIVKR